MTELAKRAQAPERPKSLYEELEAIPEEAAELAAARFSNRVLHILRQAFESSPLSQRELAAVLGVGESRVSQVLNGDGNLRVTAVARYLRAMGYTPELTALPVDATASPIVPRKRRRRKPENEGDPHVFFHFMDSNEGAKKSMRMVVQVEAEEHEYSRPFVSMHVGQLTDVEGLTRSIRRSPASESWKKVDR